MQCSTASAIFRSPARIEPRRVQRRQDAGARFGLPRKSTTDGIQALGHCEKAGAASPPSCLATLKGVKVSCSASACPSTRCDSESNSGTRLHSSRTQSVDSGGTVQAEAPRMASAEAPWMASACIVLRYLYKAG